MMAGWKPEKPFAGARPPGEYSPSEDADWETWDSRTQFIVPILELLQKPDRIVFVSIAGLKGLGKSSIIDVATYIYRSQCIYRSKKSLDIQKTEVKDINEYCVSSATHSHILVVCLHSQYSSPYSIPRLVEKVKNCPETIKKIVLVLETEEHQDSDVWKKDDVVTSSPLKISDSDSDTRRTRRSAPQRNNPPQYSYHFYDDNSKYNYETNVMKINSTSTTYSMRVLRYTKEIPPLKPEEVDRWLCGDDGKIVPQDTLWTSTSLDYEHREHSPDPIKKWAGRHPQLLAAAIERCCDSCRGGGPPCNGLELSSLTAERSISELLTAIKGKFDGDGESVTLLGHALHVLREFGLVDKNFEIAEAVRDRELLDIFEKALIALLRDDTKFSQDDLQRYWQDCYKLTVDPNWENANQRCNSNRYTLAEQLVLMCIRNRKLTDLIAAMRRDRPQAMSGFPIPSDQQEPSPHSSDGDITIIGNGNVIGDGNTVSN